MKAKRHVMVAAAAGVVLALGSVAMGVDIETVPVGNPRNAPDATGYGGLWYWYNIGKYEVTAGQYCEFLNAVAATDTYGLYNELMWTSEPGCKIQRSGSSGSYTYSVAADRADRPVSYVSFWDACRFANWLHNGQGSGDTETGAYTLTAEAIANNTVRRNPGWQWAVTSEDEWYKAAYHKNDGVTANYWDYPTSTDSRPSNELIDPDPGNNATFDFYGYTIGSPYYRTEVGAHENSESPYGTFDQGGNVLEWNEAIIDVSSRLLRGGNYWIGHGALLASYRYDISAFWEDNGSGFRVSQVPEPAALSLLALGALAVIRRGRRPTGGLRSSDQRCRTIRTRRAGPKMRKLVFLLVATSCLVVAAPWEATAGQWIIETVDSVDGGLYTSLALDASGRPRISYYSWTPSTRLKYAAWNGLSWDIETVVSPALWVRSSLALDASGRPRISYSPDSGGLKYAAWDGSSWDIQTVDASAYVGEWNSLALDASGNPRISYDDGENGHLKYAAWNGSSWDVQIVESGSGPGNVRWETSLALDADGRPRITYGFSGQLKYAAWTGGYWAIQTVDSLAGLSSLALDGTGKPRISYLTNDNLKYAALDGSSWDIEIVDSISNVADQMRTSLALDASGNPRISYGSRDNLQCVLKYAAWNGSSWDIETIDSAGPTGWYSSLALDAEGNPWISYFDRTNDNLKLAYVPEPATLGMLALGGLALVWRRRRGSGRAARPRPISFPTRHEHMVSFSTKGGSTMRNTWTVCGLWMALLSAPGLTSIADAGAIEYLNQHRTIAVSASADNTYGDADSDSDGVNKSDVGHFHASRGASASVYLAGAGADASQDSELTARIVASGRIDALADGDGTLDPPDRWMYGWGRAGAGCHLDVEFTVRPTVDPWHFTGSISSMGESEALARVSLFGDDGFYFERDASSSWDEWIVFAPGVTYQLRADIYIEPSHDDVYATGEAGWPDNDWASADFSFQLVPEPVTLTLLALGGLAVLRRRNYS